MIPENAKHDGPATQSPGSLPADDGDESLVRWMLSLTPLERLRVLTANLNAILRARAAQDRD